MKKLLIIFALLTACKTQQLTATDVVATDASEVSTLDVVSVQ